jgi:hypothetical protein
MQQDLTIHQAGREDRGCAADAAVLRDQAEAAAAAAAAMVTAQRQQQQQQQ